MRPGLRSTAVAGFVLAGLLPASGIGAQTAQPSGPFDKLKALAGEWVGTAGHGADAGPTTVTYRVSGGGSTVIETLFAGTPHEMTTVYYVSGDDILLAHYCASGHHPKMRLDRAKSESSVLRFEFAEALNFDPMTAAHMHTGTIRLLDADHIETDWAMWSKGQPTGEVARFVLARKKT